MSKTEINRVVVYIPAKLHRELKKKLRDEGRSLSWWVRSCAVGFLEGKT